MQKWFQLVAIQTHDVHLKNTIIQPWIFKRQFSSDGRGSQTGKFGVFGHGGVMQSAGCNHETALTNDLSIKFPALRRARGIQKPPVKNFERFAAEFSDEI